jgi:protein tyrosine phosphatase (PTP) superfamily phosphohydrolase (DUF442 family)
MSMKLKTCAQRSIVVVVLLLAIISVAYWFLRDNVHAVTPGELYRSAQLSRSHFERFIRQKQIKTIINLRGYNPGDTWYKEELAASKATGVQHFNVRLSADLKPSISQLRYIVTLLQTAKKPILIHCQGGADRTGLVSALWLLMHNHSLLEAKKQYGWHYLALSNDKIGPKVLQVYERWLSHHGGESSARHFFDWLHQVQWSGALSGGCGYHTQAGGC